MRGNGKVRSFSSLKLLHCACMSVSVCVYMGSRVQGAYIRTNLQ